jgi:hypothetical protein
MTLTAAAPDVFGEKKLFAHRSVALSVLKISCDFPTFIHKL